MADVGHRGPHYFTERNGTVITLFSGLLKIRFFLKKNHPTRGFFKKKRVSGGILKFNLVDRIVFFLLFYLNYAVIQ